MGCDTLRTSGTATEHGRTLHSVQKQAAQLLSPFARRPADTTCDMLRGTSCFAPMCARHATASMLRVDRWSPHHLERAADTASELRCTLIGSESSLRSQEAAHKHSQPLMMIVEMYALRPAAAVAEEHCQLEHHAARRAGACPATAPKRWRPSQAASARSLPPRRRLQNGLQKASKLVSSHTSRHWGLLFDGTTVDISIERSNLAKGIPCGPRGAMGPVRRARRGSRASLEGRPPTCNEFVTICNEYCYISR